MLRSRRALLHRHKINDEFETPAFRDLEEKQERKDDSEEASDSDDDLEYPENDESAESTDDDDLEVTVKHGDDKSDDSDDAPDDVGFSESRKTALTQMKDVMNQMKEEKLQLKTKRKLKDEKFKEQKRIKLESMIRLSDDVLNSLPEELNEPKKDDMGVQRKKKGQKKKPKKEEDGEKAETQKHLFMPEDTEDYIPLETGFVDRESGIKAMSLKEMRKKMAVSQSAANFKNSRLYGNPQQRESTKAYLAKLEKRRINHQKR